MRPRPALFSSNPSVAAYAVATYEVSGAGFSRTIMRTPSGPSAVPTVS